MNPNHSGAPDPKESIETFTTFEESKQHYIEEHLPLQSDSPWAICEKKSCLNTKANYILANTHPDGHRWPHGDIICGICGLSFERIDDHNLHVRVEHTNMEFLDSKEILDLYWSSIVS